MSEEDLVTRPTRIEGRGEMPLSEHEQKVLTELEASLSTPDPHFGDSLSGISAYTQKRRNAWWAVVGFVAGLLCLVTFFTSSIVIGLVGLATMSVSINLVKAGVTIITPTIARLDSSDGRVECGLKRRTRTLLSGLRGRHQSVNIVRKSNGFRTANRQRVGR
jgi:hypothetical protein